MWDIFNDRYLIYVNKHIVGSIMGVDWQGVGGCPNYRGKNNLKKHKTPRFFDLMLIKQTQPNVLWLIFPKCPMTLVS